MIALCYCSTSYCQNDSIPSTGGLEDSVLIAYSDLRTVNVKLIELDYEKEINAKLKDIIHNDSIALNMATNAISNADIRYKRDTKKLKRQRNGIACGGVGAIILLVISLLK